MAEAEHQGRARAAGAGKRRRSRALPEGKVPFSCISDLVRGIGECEDVLLGPAAGEDAAILRVERSRILIASDPITFATDQAGWYGVHVNANDIAASGGDPRWFTAVILMPAGSSKTDVKRILRDIRLACAEVGAVLVGGHTEITSAVTRPVVIGTMAGEVRGKRPIRSGTARPGDRLVLTKGVSIEGTALLAREFGEELAETLGERGLSAARRMLRRPGLSIVTEACVAREIPGVHAMHDLTEGGVLAGIAEMAEASGLGARVEVDRVPVLPMCRKVCEHFGLDPLRLISSGSLLMAVAEPEEEHLISELEAAGVPAVGIGRMEVTPGLTAVGSNGEVPIESPERDEFALLLESRGVSSSGGLR